ncbi:glutamate synthase-related protein, partial [Eubacterium aggregans]|uniref:glutamate synthase-related protein n=1 Tax=Eubacterium aggregans TaxID=81409 RepID=UPI003F2D80C1
MGINYIYPEFEIHRDPTRCIQCRVCERQCTNEVHSYDAELDVMRADETQFVDCQHCVSLCPTRALKIVKTDNTFRPNYNWKQSTIEEVYRQAGSGGVLLSSMGNPGDYPVYWDKMLINASQVTNPSIDTLREPMETRVFLGKKPSHLEFDKQGNLISDLPTQIELELPIMFSAMSYGSISENAHKSLARAATELGTCYNTGEGGLNKEFYQYGPNTIVQVASGRFGVHEDYLMIGAAIEIKMGQGAKPGIGGHLPGHKIGQKVSETRMILEGSDDISPAPNHDIYSIEDLRQLIFSLKEATDYKKPVIVKIAAVHNVAAIASGIARSGADVIAIDGFRGGTGAAHTRIRDNVGIPIELALAAVDQRLRDEKIRNDISIVVGGSIRSSADVVKAIAMVADACYIGSSALMALGCHLCRACQQGKCNWGIATQREDLVKRLNPDIGAHRLVNLVRAWDHEIKEMMGVMGINSIESLKGNRLM